MALVENDVSLEFDSFLARYARAQDFFFFFTEWYETIAPEYESMSVRSAYPSLNGNIVPVIIHVSVKIVIILPTRLALPIAPHFCCITNRRFDASGRGKEG